VPSFEIFKGCELFGIIIRSPTKLTMINMIIHNLVLMLITSLLCTTTSFVLPSSSIYNNYKKGTRRNLGRFTVNTVLRYSNNTDTTTTTTTTASAPDLSTRKDISSIATKNDSSTEVKSEQQGSKDESEKQHNKRGKGTKLVLPNSYTTTNSNKDKTTINNDSNNNEIIGSNNNQCTTSKLSSSSSSHYYYYFHWMTSRIKTRWDMFWKTQQSLKPGTKFRIRLGLATLTLTSVLSLVLPFVGGGATAGVVGAGGAAKTTATTTATAVAAASTITRGARSVWMVVQKWLSHRGFQGIAAFGRSVAYGWALFVAYPRMLDRRAKDRTKREQEKAVERWRIYLRSLAAEVVRLRQELSSIDGEIRTFRREIITLKASLARYGRNNDDFSRPSSSSSDDNGEKITQHTSSSSKDEGWDPEIQEAITQEMAHLVQIRDDTRAALAAARKAWSEMRAQSPLEAWEADDMLLMTSPDAVPPSL
jgi:hypothetical protein